MTKVLLFSLIAFVITLAVSMLIAVVIHLIGKIVQGKKSSEKAQKEDTDNTAADKGKVVVSR